MYKRSRKTTLTVLLLPFLLLVLTLPRTSRAQNEDEEESGGIPMGKETQPETPISEWTGRTILITGAHPDDDAGSYGTLAMLQDHGNEVYVLIMTTGNVGTKDPDMTRDHLAKIRRQEELGALSEIGIPEDHYINLGYTDGLLQFTNKKAVLRRLVRHIREIKPDVMISFSPGYGYQAWHKTDHRRAAYLSTDAARMAEWRLLFPGQIIHGGLEAHAITAYMFYGGLKKDKNMFVDVTGEYAEEATRALAHHQSQYTSSWKHYRAELPADEKKKFIESIRKRKQENKRNGKIVEGFRYYRGIPDGMGARR